MCSQKTVYKILFVEQLICKRDSIKIFNALFINLNITDDLKTYLIQKMNNRTRLVTFLSSGLPQLKLESEIPIVNELEHEKILCWRCVCQNN